MEVIRFLIYITIFGLAILLLQENLLFLSQILYKVSTAKHVTVSFKDVFVGNHVSERFLSVTFSCSLFRHKHTSKHFPLRSKKMKTLARELSPSYLRVGGTLCDFLIFNMTEDTTLRFKPHKPRYIQINGEWIDANTNFTMTPYDWDLLNIFAMESGWDLIFDFNVFLRKNGQWDPTNAIELLKYTIQQGYKPAGYELGNEPNSLFHKFNFSIPAPEMAEYFSILKQTLDSLPALGKPIIVGPDTTAMRHKSAREYFIKFLESGGGDIVDIASFHHYYLNSATATVAEFHEAKVLDSLIVQLNDALAACRNYAPGKQCWLGETSSSYGGGAGGISDRYVASFLWLDKLGLSAKMGLQGVMRQSFYGGNYGLIDANLDPNPDYWLTVLYKRLVGNIVLDIGTSTNTNLRYYAQCANINSTMGYKVGDVVVYLMNIGGEAISVDIKGVSSSTYHIYMLSPGDSTLTSQSVKLNGEILKMQSDVILPIFDPIVQEGGQITVNPYNMGFIVLPNSKLLQCI
ncbi:hypothetical protein LOTGIDRAFT_231761 [Lottia gigantea]|uniref:Uncharacterized protein n=1 Tax=Lottia gigantea TaxID=225164 RepID=V4AIZ4_LOTGI|nr:hypothetical protein LOTGIDRAFT_231761 [Lottia gigantea]ESO97017.1 hypothetical protein LOTGIDRAFT_231761 [Lottia gigantea]